MNMFTTIAQAALAKNTVASIFTASKTGHDQLLTSWQNSIDLVWDNADIPAILAEMGTEAKAMFDLSTRTYVLLEANVAGCTNDRRAKIKPYTVHDDGTVTLDPVTDPVVA